MQGKLAILDRTPKEIDDVTKKILLDIYFEFVVPNRLRNFEIWEAGMQTVAEIGRAHK